VIIHALAHFAYQPDADSFLGALNARLAEIAEAHGRKPFILIELGTGEPVSVSVMTPWFAVRLIFPCTCPPAYRRIYLPTFLLFFLII
jgi:hypothetical protein